MRNINEIRESNPKCSQSIERTNFIFLDIETTGLCVEKGSKLMEVAILDRNKVLFTWNQTSSNASDENLKNELPKILKNLKSGVVVGHNVCFDLNFIAYKAGKFGHTGPNVFFIDTLNLSRRLIETVSSYKLEFLLQYFNISIHGELHTALVDAQATQALFWKLIERGEIGTLKEVGMKKLNWSFF